MSSLAAKRAQDLLDSHTVYDCGIRAELLTGKHIKSEAELRVDKRAAGDSSYARAAALLVDAHPRTGLGLSEFEPAGVGGEIFAKSSEKNTTRPGTF